MQYYIEISSWNLLESFVTESLSPYSFYTSRNFGNNLSRYLSGEKEKLNYLILSTEDLGGDISLIVDESLIDTTCLKRINKRLTTAYTYPKTIYYKKGFVKFRFETSSLKDSIIAESQILLEVKCLDKYVSDFFIKSKRNKVKTDISNLKDSSLPIEMPIYIRFDERFNKLKGAIVGYVRGEYTSPDANFLQLQNELRNLKNSFGGLNTQIMMSEFFVDNPQIIDKIVLCKKLYMTQIGETNNFDVLVAQFQEVIRLAKLRSEEFSLSTTFSKEELVNEKTLLEDRIAKIELENNIYAIREELDDIKFKERSNGKITGKSRVYFKKGTEEYDRKQYLKKLIIDFENGNIEYKESIDRLNYIEKQLNKNNYDATLSAIFNRISDILNEVIINASKTTNISNINLSRIRTEINSVCVLNEQQNPEIRYFNILLSCILNDSSAKQLSEHYVLLIMEESAKLFKDDILSKTEKGTKILTTLREFWLYKNQRVDQFSIPEDMPVLQSIMSFLVKPLGFEQIERYMSLKKYSQRSYALMLWGAWLGFADIPKTFTNVLFQNDDINKLIENKVNELVNELSI